MKVSSRKKSEPDESVSYTDKVKLSSLYGEMKGSDSCKTDRIAFWNIVLLLCFLYVIAGIVIYERVTR